MDVQQRDSVIEEFQKYDALAQNKATVISNLGIWELARQYAASFDKKQAEGIIAKEYNLHSNEEGPVVKQHILKVMDAVGLNESKTLNTLEDSYLKKLVAGCENADEKACEEIKSKIVEFNASKKYTEKYTKIVQKRIEKIWSAEDGEIFDNIYAATDITNPQSIKESISYIESKNRSDAAKKYLKALNYCNPKRIERAKVYGSKKTLFRIILVVLFLLLLLMENVSDGIFMIAGLCWFVLLIYVLMCKRAWKVLTIKGTQVHPMIGIKEKAQKKRKK